MIVKLEIFPNFPGKNEKIFELPPPTSSFWYDSNYFNHLLRPRDLILKNRLDTLLFLVGGFNSSEKYSSKWESSTNRVENQKYLKPPPRFYLPYYYLVAISSSNYKLLPVAPPQSQWQWFVLETPIVEDVPYSRYSAANIGLVEELLQIANRFKKCEQSLWLKSFLLNIFGKHIQKDWVLVNFKRRNVQLGCLWGYRLNDCLKISSKDSRAKQTIETFPWQRFYGMMIPNMKSTPSSGYMFQKKTIMTMVV